MIPSRPRPSGLRPAVVLAAVVAAAAVGARPALAQPARPTTPTRPAAGATADSARPFLGTWELTAFGTGQGDLTVTLGVARADTGLVASLISGPGLTPRSARAAGDSLVVTLTAGGGRPASDDYWIVLRARADSVRGTWAGPDGSGRIAGRRTGP